MPGENIVVTIESLYVHCKVRNRLSAVNNDNGSVAMSHVYHFFYWKHGSQCV